MLLSEPFTLTTDTQQFNLSLEQEITKHNTKHLVPSTLTLTLKLEHLHSNSTTIKKMAQSQYQTNFFFDCLSVSVKSVMSKITS